MSSHSILHLFLILFLVIGCSARPKIFVGQRIPASIGAVQTQQSFQLHQILREGMQQYQCQSFQDCQLPGSEKIDRVKNQFEEEVERTFDELDRLARNYRNIRDKLTVIANSAKKTTPFAQAYRKEVQAMNKILKDFSMQYAELKKKTGRKSAVHQELVRLREITSQGKSGKQEIEAYVESWRAVARESDEIWSLIPVNFIPTLEIANPTYVRSLTSVAPYLNIDPSCTNMEDSTLENNIYYVQFPVLAISTAKHSDPNLDANNLDIIRDNKLIKKLINGTGKTKRPLKIVCHEAEKSELITENVLRPNYREKSHTLAIYWAKAKAEGHSFHTVVVTSGVAVRALLRERLQ